MRKTQAIELAGSGAALGRLLRISRAAVSQWGDDVPELYVYRLRDLKPEWFPDSSPGTDHRSPETEATT